MKLNDTLTSAIFVARPNRFITIININGKEHNSHLPDPGRLKELLVVGCKLWVRNVTVSYTHLTLPTTSRV